jgi:mannosyltransferase OCH1-like enzyme
MKKIGMFLVSLFCLIHCQLFPTDVRVARAFASLYEAYLHQPKPASSTYIIPKKIHFIWLGSPLPESCKMMVESWRRFHPSWKVKVWTDADVANFSFRNKAVYDQAKNFGEKADILRYEILYSFGGIYADIDFECLKPFDSIATTCEFFVGIDDDSNPSIGNALIGSIPGHPILKYCIDSIPQSSQDHDLWRIVTETGPLHLTKCFLVLAQHFRGRVVVFPRSVFYPFPVAANKNFPREVIKKQWVRPESMAIHYWTASWVVQ